MPIREVRLRRMNELIAQRFEGKAAAFARAIKRTPSQVNQWQSGVRTITEESARMIEKALRLDPGWMDQPSVTAVSEHARSFFEDTPSNYNLASDEVRTAVDKLLDLSPRNAKHREALARMINAYYETHAK